MVRIIFMNAVGNDGFDFDTHGCGGDDGNYPQGTINIVFSDGTVIQISDTSCGAFGTRINGCVLTGVGIKHSFQYGSMLETELWYSEIYDEYYCQHLELVQDALGYHIPTKSELEEEV